MKINNELLLGRHTGENTLGIIMAVQYGLRTTPNHAYFFFNLIDQAITGYRVFEGRTRPDTFITFVEDEIRKAIKKNPIDGQRILLVPQNFFRDRNTAKIFHLTGGYVFLYGYKWKDSKIPPITKDMHLILSEKINKQLKNPRQIHFFLKNKVENLNKLIKNKFIRNEKRNNTAEQEATIGDNIPEESNKKDSTDSADT